MRFGQFCGFLADEMGLQHSDFIRGAELLFSMGLARLLGMAVSFPDRNTSPNRMLPTAAPQMSARISLQTCPRTSAKLNSARDPSTASTKIQERDEW